MPEAEVRVQDFAAERAAMVAQVELLYAQTRPETGLAAISPTVRAALAKVERHRLVPPEQVRDAYCDRPLPIGDGQTISQPYIVALCTDLIDPRSEHTVLEVGTGSGYQAAMLGEIVRRVYTIEILAGLAERARAQLGQLGYANIEVRVGDGGLGWPEKAPFDGIIVSAATARVPQPLVAQLRPGARMVIPLGELFDIQVLTLITKRVDGGYDERRVLPVRFVPLVPGAAP